MRCVGCTGSRLLEKEAKKKSKVTKVLGCSDTAVLQLDVSHGSFNYYSVQLQFEHILWRWACGRILQLIDKWLSNMLEIWDNTLEERSNYLSSGLYSLLRYDTACGDMHQLVVFLFEVIFAQWLVDWRSMISFQLTFSPCPFFDQNSPMRGGTITNKHIGMCFT